MSRLGPSTKCVKKKKKNPDSNLDHHLPPTLAGRHVMRVRPNLHDTAIELDFSQ